MCCHSEQVAFILDLRLVILLESKIDLRCPELTQLRLAVSTCNGVPNSTFVLRIQPQEFMSTLLSVNTVEEIMIINSCPFYMHIWFICSYRYQSHWEIRAEFISLANSLSSHMCPHFE